MLPDKPATHPAVRVGQTVIAFVRLLLWVYAIVVTGYVYGGIVVWAQTYSPPDSWYGGAVVLFGQSIVAASFLGGYVMARRKGVSTVRPVVIAIVYLAIQTIAAIYLHRY